MTSEPGSAAGPAPPPVHAVRPAAPGGLGQPVAAGLVTAIVGFASSVSVVLAGLRAAGASEREAASGLLVLSVAMGALAIWLSVRRRMPISIAWSTPGAALLLSAGVPPGGWPAAVGAFALAGGLIVLTGAWRRLGRWIEAIPGPLASAMLAGVLLPICLAPARSAVQLPWLTAPIVLTWVVMLGFARRWAVPGAVLVAAVVILIDRSGALHGAAFGPPELSFTTPHLTAGAVVGIAIPLFLVTMASQNVPGITVLGSYGYRPPLPPLLVGTGAASIIGAPFGGHAINLAAITAALAAGPEAGPDRDRRWIAAATAGATYIAFGLAAGVIGAFVALAPPLLVEAVAGLALIGALAGALQAATADTALREAAIVTLVVTASGITALGISAPFWGLVAGLATGSFIQRVRPRAALP